MEVREDVLVERRFGRPLKEKRNDTVINIWMPHETKNKLFELAEKKNISLAELVRKAIQTLLNSEEN